ncbi:ABC transporter permease subunit [Mycolicibacterium sp. P9-64]|uniref:ABC transporter permease n=1 Tax=Mycolicibacterium sp. P9-64 TaxID=2024612 RepID=UPI0018D93AA9|nr:ABC transporter permease subunit [Mycolicibacterium sp. P9-64]
MAAMTTATRRAGLGRAGVLAIAAVYFLVPLAASFWFTIHNDATGFSFATYGDILTADGFTQSLFMSLGLGVATIIVVLALMLPAMLAVRLGAPKLGQVLEVICTLPLVVPPITFVAGISTVLRWAPDQLASTPFWATLIAIQKPSFPIVLVLAYVVLATPFVYRSLDAGLRAIDVKTLVEAARNLGAGWTTVMFRTILPNLRTSIASAAFLTLALVLGEYTIAVLLGFRPFAVWIVTISGANAQLSVAVSVLSLILTWALLLVVSGVGRKRT